MTELSHLERVFCNHLRDFPRTFQNIWSDAAEHRLVKLLFESLCNDNPDYLGVLFSGNLPPDNGRWSLSEAQGATAGAEYTEAARGKPCGHILKSGEPSYRCKTCTADDTCVLCSRCFEASNHEGHQVLISVSHGNAGCCDCGDPEAWRLPVHCNIHSVTSDAETKGKAVETAALPPDLIESIRATISRSLDYLLDVFSCSPEELKLKKSEDSILEDERRSRLLSPYFSEKRPEQQDRQFCLVLWNDEKHNPYDARDAVARATKMAKSSASNKAVTCDRTGRSLIKHSDNLNELLEAAKIIESTKFATTIRSARDTFREEMCGTIVRWFSDIAGCSVGRDNHILRNTICEELLKPWNKGSEAHRETIGSDPVFDYEDYLWNSSKFDDAAAFLAARPAHRRRFLETQLLGRDPPAAEGADDSDREDGEVMDDDDDDEMEDRPAADETETPDQDMDDALEVSEATMAGYPPPPLPPAPRPEYLNPNLHSPPRKHDSGVPINIPMASKIHGKAGPAPSPPNYWTDVPAGFGPRGDLPPHLDLWQRIRIDWMILYDLRMWNQLRCVMRDLFISTVVNVANFKKILGLRFAGLYAPLAQLYLIADREPDCSIISLSLQMLTTPTITAEIIERGNFLSTLMAIIYTFVTTRQVGYPGDVNLNATLAFEAGIAANRRLDHFFHDMKCLFNSPLALQQIRHEERYLLQFLDLVKLHQGIVPNVRALGEHVEYEPDTWMNALNLSKQINRLCREIASAFDMADSSDDANVNRAIRQTAKVAIINSLGSERQRFPAAETKEDAHFKTILQYEFEDKAPGAVFRGHCIVDFAVEKGEMSFHHALHYTLSWLIEKAKVMEAEKVRKLLTFTTQDLRAPPTPPKAKIPECSELEHILILFDTPLRLCAWLAQIRSKMWVRNGVTLSHQMSQYKNVLQRDVGYHRDLFLLQVALVVLDPADFLASMIARFGLSNWVKGLTDITEPTVDETQTADVADEFIHLLTILLSDRLSLLTVEDEPDVKKLGMMREIAQVLYFKPLSHSTLANSVAEKYRDDDDFEDVLKGMTTFRAPEGINDAGLFELKKEYIDQVDLYTAPYSRNQRDEAELIYCEHMAKKTGKPAKEIVFEPKLPEIRSGLFKNLASFTATPLFAQIIYAFLKYLLEVKHSKDKKSPSDTKGLVFTQVERFLQTLLHLTLLAIAEDKTDEETMEDDQVPSFALNAITLESNDKSRPTILSVLAELRERKEFEDFSYKIRTIFRRLHEKRPHLFTSSVMRLRIHLDRLDTESPLPSAGEEERKKNERKARAARALAQMQERQKVFAMNQDVDWGKDELSDSDETVSTPPDDSQQFWTFPRGPCNYCQEECNDDRLYGTLSFITESSILRQTPQADNEWVAEVFDVPANLDSQYDRTRPFGVAGQNHVDKLLPNGRTVDFQTLGKGFPRNSTLIGPVGTGCGHLMHHSCFENYIAATDARHRHQTARHQPENLKIRQFLCPYCKALGNAFLPVIWKPKAFRNPTALDKYSQLDDLMVKSSFREEGSSAPMQVDNDNPQSSKELKPSNFFDCYIESTLTQKLSAGASELTLPGSPVPGPTNFQRLPGFFPQDLDQTSDSSDVRARTPMAELLKVYGNIRESLKLAGFESGCSRTWGSSEGLTHTDVLSETLAFSISATEIAQRGVQSDYTLVDSLSSQTLTYLNVLSETVTSYLAIGVIQNNWANRTRVEFEEQQDRLGQQLFNYDVPAGHQTPPPLLKQDAFLYLAKASVFLVPPQDIRSVLPLVRLAYLLEIVKVVISYGWRLDSKTIDLAVFDNVKISNPEANSKWTCDAEQERAFLMFAMGIYQQCKAADSNVSEADSTIPEMLTSGKGQHFLARLRTVVASYVLPFLRKTAILMHVRFGINFNVPGSVKSGADVSELDKLFSALRLPNLNEIVALVSGPSRVRLFLSSLTQGWIEHWMPTVEGVYGTSSLLGSQLTLSHPGIFELIGLPWKYATLADASIAVKCPNSGAELKDPCLCLWCGELFCGQAECCTMGQRRGGGAQRHREICGNNIGIYIAIRKCVLLFLHSKHGSYFPAPYLDDFGEPDQALRRQFQLYLNQKRLDDFVRKAWLNHMIPSEIARNQYQDGTWPLRHQLELEYGDDNSFIWDIEPDGTAITVERVAMNRAGARNRVLTLGLNLMEMTQRLQDE